MSACSSCGAPITWAKSARGKAMPMQVDPNGEWSIDDHGVAWKVGTLPLALDALAETMGVTPKKIERYTSHFATCPDAGEHRRKS